MVPLFVLAHFSHHLVTALPSPLTPYIRDEFSLDYTQAGWVISAFTLAYGIGQLPAGWLADRIGPRIMLTIGICGVAVAAFLIGLSQTYIMMLVFLALMGLAGGGYHPSAPPVIASAVGMENRGRALGLHMIGGSLSFFLAPIIAAEIAEVWSWRGSFIGLAIPAMLFGIVFYILLGRRLTASRAANKAAVSQIEAPSPPGRWRRLVWFIILSTSTQAVTFSVIAFIPLFLVDHFGVSQAAGARAIAFIYFCGLWVSPIAGYLSDRLGRVPVVLAAAFMVGPVLYLLNVVPYGIGISTLMNLTNYLLRFGIDISILADLVPYGIGIAALLILIGVFLYVRMPVSESYILGQVSERNRSTILGIYFLGSMEGAGILTPVMGKLIDNFGFATSFSIAGATVLGITILCSFFLWGDRS
ncbi:MAG: MFS transporter [Chloroflexi bacterium]|nr:MFS transporter [Chloroflexota bacterium]